MAWTQSHGYGRKLPGIVKIFRHMVLTMQMQDKKKTNKGGSLK